MKHPARIYPALVLATLGQGIGASSPTGSTPEELERVIRSGPEKWKKAIEVPRAKAE